MNFNLGAQVKSAKVTVALPQGKKATGIQMLSPDRGPEKLGFTMEGNRVRFSLPPLEVYNVAVIELAQ